MPSFRSSKARGAWDASVPPIPTCGPQFVLAAYWLIKHLKVVKWPINFEFIQFAYHYYIMVWLIWHSSTEAA